MVKLAKTLLIKSSILFSSLLSIGQEPAAELAQWSKQFPNQKGVFLKRVEVVYITQQSNGEPIISSTSEDERIFFDKNAKQYSSSSVYSNSFIQSSIEEAYSLIPNGNKYKKVKVKDFFESEDFGRGVFFSDEKKMSFEFPGMTQGAKTYIRTTEKFVEPRFFGRFHFSSYLPTVKSEYKVFCDPDISLEWKLFGQETDLISFEKSKEGKYDVYTWTASNLDQIEIGPNSPSIQYLSPHVMLRIGSYISSSGKKVSYLKTPKDLHNWYATFLDSLNSSAYEELIPLADSITKDKSSEFEKVKAIYYWVQDNIKYIAFEDGYGGFIPREAPLVCSRKYGDCKDMSNTIFTLLKAANIKGYYTWVGSRQLPYKYSEFPSPGIDNHMICTYYDSLGTPYFLDATGKQLPTGLVNSFIQSKEAFVHIDSDSFRIEEIPITSYKSNVYADTFDMRITPELLVEGKGKLTVNSYFQHDMSYAFDALSQKELDDYYNILFGRGNNKSIATATVDKSTVDRDTPTQISYSFTIDDYVKSYENELYFNPYVLKRFLEMKIDETEDEFFVEREFEQSQLYHITISIPEGYTIKKVPSNVSKANDIAEYSAKYTVSKDKSNIILDLSYIEKSILIPSTEYELYNEVINTLKSSFSEIIIFEKL